MNKRLDDAGLPPLPCAGRHFLFHHQSIRAPGCLLVRHIEPLRKAVKCTRAGRPFHNDAWVVLPDHMHCVITLPPGDDDFSNRIKAMKIRFVQALPPTEGRSSVRMAKGDRGIWQRRFWEHAIRDEGDYARHMDYVHFNPVRRGYVSVVAHWPDSIFHRWVKAGAYPRHWGGQMRWMLPPASVDDNFVMCHSAGTPLRGFRPTRAF